MGGYTGVLQNNDTAPGILSYSLVYNPRTSQWSSGVIVEAMRNARMWFGAVSYSGAIYVFGGYSSTGTPISAAETAQPCF